jgi:plasmid stabilization system protein ParE
MTYTPVSRPQVLLDIDDAYNWYNNHVQGLGKKFVDDFENTVSKILENPYIYPVTYKTFRRSLLKKFPYSVFYHIDKQTILIIACLHFKQDIDILSER